MIENILLALGAIRANKMRSFLTMLGIIIGIGSVIGIVTVGNSLTNSFTDSMQQLGTNNISVSVMQRIDSDFNMTSAMSSMPAEADMYSDEQIADIELRFADDIDAIALSQSVGNGKATEGRDYANAAVIGVNAGYQKAANLTLTDGRFLSERDIDGRKRVCVVSDRFVKNLFPRLTGSGVGQEILINMGNGTIDSYYIIGVYEYQETGFSFGFSSEKDLRTDVYVPLSIAMKTAQYQNYMSFMIITKPGTDNGVFSSGLRRYLNNTYYAENDLWTAQVISMESAMSIMGDVMGTISTAVAVIAAISLLVGGIGVMNIMLVSVTERTSEIGIRKALGAKNSHIRIQFIMESVILCAIGGVIGVGLGIVMGNVGASLLGFPATASPEIIVIAVLFSMTIGIFFGYYPANKAAKLDVIEALRYE